MATKKHAPVAPDHVGSDAFLDKPATVEPLADYLVRIELAAQPLPVCEVVHPDAIDGTIHNGTFAGIRLITGYPVSARLSDGSTL